MKTRNQILPLAAAMGSLALTAVTANAGTIVTDFSNFSESGDLISAGVDQDFATSGADITISTTDDSGLGQEVFLSDEFPTLATGDRVSIDIPNDLGAGGSGDRARLVQLPQRRQAAELGISAVCGLVRGVDYLAA